MVGNDCNSMTMSGRRTRGDYLKKVGVLFLLILSSCDHGAAPQDLIVNSSSVKNVPDVGYVVAIGTFVTLVIVPPGNALVQGSGSESGNSSTQWILKGAEKWKLADGKTQVLEYEFNGRKRTITIDQKTYDADKNKVFLVIMSEDWKPKTTPITSMKNMTWPTEKIKEFITKNFSVPE